MKSLILLLMLAFSVVLMGCANTKNNSTSKWSEESKAKIQAGQMLWSDYYTQLFEKIEKNNNSSKKGQILNLINSLIAASQKYESGKMSKEDFDSFQRTAKAAFASISSNEQANNNAILGNGISIMSNSFKQNADYFQNKIDSQFTCTKISGQTNCY